MNRATLAIQDMELENQRFITRVYGWMSLALLLTGFVAMRVASSQEIIAFLMNHSMLFLLLFIGELALVGYLTAAVRSMSANTALLVFLGYSALNGVTLSFIFLIYTAQSLSSTFLLTALTFAIMSFYGYVTKSDLTRVGNLAFMGLIGIILASVFNIFFKSPMLYWMTTYIGILIFVALTAYDTQKIKAMNVIGNEGSEEDRKESIMGALILYLDFINLFLLLLRLFGRRR